MSGGGCSKGPVKIVIINTQYVETDATSFKSVVQKLTGKESDHSATTEAAAKAAEREKHNDNNNGCVVEMPATASGGGSFGYPFLMRDESFKEFDRLLSQVPPINDLW